MRIEDNAWAMIALLAEIAKMDATQQRRLRTGQTPTIAMCLARAANAQFNYYARRGDACMAHSKHLQERYWEGRGNGASNNSYSEIGGGSGNAGTVRMVRTNTGHSGQRNYLFLDSDGKVVGGGAD